MILNNNTTDQELVLMFRFQHGRHFFKVSAVMLFFQVRQVENRDDTLSDVGQIEIILTAHQLLHNTLHAVSTVKHTYKKEVLIYKYMQTWRNFTLENKKFAYFVTHMPSQPGLLGVNQELALYKICSYLGGMFSWFGNGG